MQLLLKQPQTVAEPGHALGADRSKHQVNGQKVQGVEFPPH